MGKIQAAIRKLFRKSGKESAVAEIIGVVLIFAIVISLFTTFIVWYVPATGTANEQHYTQETQSAFYSFAEGLSDSAVAQGQTQSYSFPLGIQGVQPFSPSNPTSLSFSRNFDNFSASLSFRLTVTYTPSGGSLTYFNETGKWSAAGVFKSNALTQFTIPTTYDVQDGFLIQKQGNSGPASGIGPLPLGINTTSQGVTLSSRIFNITGQSITASQVGASLLSLYYSQVNSTSLSAGRFMGVNGTAGTIDGLTLDYYYYNVSGIYASQWNYALYQQFNNSAATYGQASAQPSWDFTNHSFRASSTGRSVSVFSSQGVKLAAVDLTYMNLGMQSI